MAMEEDGGCYYPDGSVIPVVPYESYSEYRGLLASLIVEYGGMVDESVRDACIDTWYRFHSGLSWGVRDYWLKRGPEIFMLLTKGGARGWCEAMNRMVVHSLDVATRVMVMSHLRLGCRIGGTDFDRRFVTASMLREVRLAIADPASSVNNMTEFEVCNFRLMLPPDIDWEEMEENNCNGGDLGREFETWHLPVGKLRERKLAFAMGTHARLGCGGAALGGLGTDMVALVLAFVDAPC